MMKKCFAIHVNLKNVKCEMKNVCDPTFRSGCDERILNNRKVKRKSDEKSF
jgi:hypothetical protein